MSLPLKVKIFTRTDSGGLETEIGNWLEAEGIAADRLVRIEYAVGQSARTGGDYNDYEPNKTFTALVLYMERR